MTTLSPDQRPGQPDPAHYLPHPDRRAWPAQAHHVKAMLGLKENDALPEAGMPERLVHGIAVWVVPLKRGPFALRVYARCPVCGTEVAAGRLYQHAKVHAAPVHV
jgi:hypothetical protein